MSRETSLWLPLFLFLIVIIMSVLLLLIPILGLVGPFIVVLGLVTIAAYQSLREFWEDRSSSRLIPLKPSPIAEGSTGFRRWGVEIGRLEPLSWEIKMDGVVQGWVRQATANQLVVNERDGSVLVYVPPGEFEMGDDYRFIDWASGESCCDCPKHRVWLDGYYIGIYAVTNAQYLAFVEAKGHRTPDRVELPPMLRAMLRESWKPVWKGRSFPPEKANHPVVCVSWKDAQAYAKWAGLILPTEAQWERAVRGPENLAYPWGDISDADGCRGNRDSGSEGHVREWCEDWYHAVYYSTQPASFQFQNPRGPKKGLNRVIRGSAFSCPASRRGYLDPDYGHDNLGFRLARAV